MYHEYYIGVLSSENDQSKSQTIVTEKQEEGRIIVSVGFFCVELTILEIQSKNDAHGEASALDKCTYSLSSVRM